MTGVAAVAAVVTAAAPAGPGKAAVVVVIAAGEAGRLELAVDAGAAGAWPCLCMIGSTAAQ